ncbi:S8 family serine peptidase [Nitrosomonas sp.]|uniref:S8 family serine peptidase n=1 Tax=Nitrosomonas sp. TaxID=42353 RepID=UPI0020826C41|nr:S8 family serine peptidase [Nitrosomonas sp.]GJL74234.1 MAG: hypothetical protein NMNS02_03400 [Nitrosomonas sp.]
MRNPRILALAGALFISFVSFSVMPTQADSLALETEEAFRSGNLYIENSYFIGFKNASAFDLEPRDQPLIDLPDESKRGLGIAPFGEHSTGQSKENLAGMMGLQGEVLSILDSINTVHVKMDSDEAERWRKDERVEYVEQDMLLTFLGTQTNPGWALDRIDEIAVTLDNTYTYTNNGAGRKVYVLDSGLDLRISKVATEFGGRAQIVWDVNYNSGGPIPPDWGADCNGHGTSVASLIAGNTKGIARGASLKIAKVTIGCSFDLDNDPIRLSHIVTALNWIAFNETAGTIVNLSNGIQPGGCGPAFSSTLDNSVKEAHNRGKIVVVAAGNDGCNTANFSPTHLSEAFVVGATSSNKISSGKDAKASQSRTGWNISTFAPGISVNTLDKNGNPIIASGTSLSTAMLSGIFAISCQSAGSFCNTITNGTQAYNALKVHGVIGTVTDPDGTQLTGATSRFIPQKW